MNTMSSIFDTLLGKMDSTKEIYKLAKLFEEDITRGGRSLEEFIDEECFISWEGRGSCLPLGLLFNNLDIRHNNIDGKNANSITRDMPDTKKMELYDRCYQLYVTAVLIYEYITNHKDEIENLKTRSPTG